MKKPLFILATIFIFFFVSLFGLKYLSGSKPVKSDHKEKKNMTLKQALRRVSRDINKSLPKNMNSTLRFNNTKVVNKKFYLYYTLRKVQFSQVNKKKFKSKTYQKLKNKVCKMKEYRVFLNNGATFEYNYSGNKGHHITQIDIRASDCSS